MPCSLKKYNSDESDVYLPDYTEGYKSCVQQFIYYHKAEYFLLHGFNVSEVNGI